MHKRTEYILGAAAAVLVLLAAASLAPDAYAQTQIGGVSVDGEWYVGEGLGVGDYFSYSMCHVNYKECKKFQMDFWIEGEQRVGGEEKWLASTVVYDGKKIIKGTMELGKIAPEPTGGSPDLLPYRSAFKSSIVWLSAFATSYGGDGGEGPKRFDIPSWGKIANIGGEQILPTESRTVTVRGGTFEDAVSLTWRTGGARSEVWIMDEFPFPILASTWVHVSEGIPPQEYNFELISHGTSETDPYARVIPTGTQDSTTNCPADPELVKTKQTTRNGDYIVSVQHGPETPIAGCDMVTLISFFNKYDETEFLNQVQYDVVVTDTDDVILHRVSEEEGVRSLYSGSGQTRNEEMWVPSQPGDYVYAIVVYGLAPINEVPRADLDILHVPITVVADLGVTPPTTTTDRTDPNIPSWIKRTTGFWVDGITSDIEFTSAIEFLISEDVIHIGEVEAPQREADSGIPSWIKRTAGFWVDGITSDIEFISAIEFLVSKGIIVVE